MATQPQTSEQPPPTTTELSRPRQHVEIDWFDPQRTGPLLALAKTYADTEIIPKHFQKKPADCFVIMQLAARIGMDPLGMLQRTYVVHGKPGMEAKLMIAMVNQRGPFREAIGYEYSGAGDSRQCVAFGNLKGSGARREAKCTVELAKAEGWWANKKWQTMTDQMLAYRAASFLINLVCPEVTMGMHTVEELVDVAGEEPRPVITHEINDDATNGDSIETEPLPTAADEKRRNAIDAIKPYLADNGIPESEARVWVGGKQLTYDELTDADVSQLRENCRLIRDRNATRDDLLPNPMLGLIEETVVAIEALPTDRATALMKAVGFADIKAFKQNNDPKKLMVLIDAIDAPVNGDGADDDPF